MIILEENIDLLSLVNIKLNVPQVGSSIESYLTLSDIEDDTIFDFIVNEDGEVLIGKGHYKLNKRKKTLLFAGRLKIRDGLISYIDNESGHYFPSKEQLEVFYNFIKNTKYAHSNIEFKNVTPEVMQTERIRTCKICCQSPAVKDGMCSDCWDVFNS